MRKRVLSMVLALCMILTAVPGVFAEGITGDSSGGIMLTSIAGGNEGPFADLNEAVEKAIESAESEGAEGSFNIVIDAAETLTKDLIINANNPKTEISIMGKEGQRAINSDKAKIIVQRGTLLLNNIDLSGMKSAPVIEAEGTVKLSGSKLVSNPGAGSAAFDVKNGGSVTIETGSEVRVTGTLAKFTDFGNQFEITSGNTVNVTSDYWFTYGENAYAPTESDDARITIPADMEVNGFIVYNKEGFVVNIANTLTNAVKLAEANSSKGYYKIKFGSKNVAVDDAVTVTRPMIIDKNGVTVDEGKIKPDVGIFMSGTDPLYFVPDAVGIKNVDKNEVAIPTVSVSPEGEVVTTVDVVATIDEDVNFSTSSDGNNRYWAGIGLIAPTGAKKVEYSTDDGESYTKNNKEGELDVLHPKEGDNLSGFGYWFDASKFPTQDVEGEDAAKKITLKWLDENNAEIGIYTYNILLAKRPDKFGAFKPEVLYFGYGETKDAAKKEAEDEKNLPKGYEMDPKGFDTWIDQTMWVTFAEPIPDGLSVALLIKNPKNQLEYQVCIGDGKHCVYAWSYLNKEQTGENTILPGEYEIVGVMRVWDPSGDNSIGLGSLVNQQGDPKLKLTVFGVGGITAGFKADYTKGLKEINDHRNSQLTGVKPPVSDVASPNLMYVLFNNRVKIPDGESMKLTVTRPKGTEPGEDTIYEEQVNAADVDDGVSVIYFVFPKDETDIGPDKAGHAYQLIQPGEYTFKLTDGDGVVLGETSLTLEKCIYDAVGVDPEKNPNAKFKEYADSNDPGVYNEDRTQYVVYRKKDDADKEVVAPKHRPADFGQYDWQGWSDEVPGEDANVKTYNGRWKNFIENYVDKIDFYPDKAEADQVVSAHDAGYNTMIVTLNDRWYKDDMFANNKLTLEVRKINEINEDGTPNEGNTSRIYTEDLTQIGDDGVQRVYFKFPALSSGAVGSGNTSDDTASQQLKEGTYSAAIYANGQKVGDSKFITLYKVVYDAGAEGDFSDVDPADVGFGSYNDNQYTTYIDSEKYGSATTTPDKKPTPKDSDNYFIGWNEPEKPVDNVVTYKANWGSYKGISIDNVGFKTKKADADTAIKDLLGKEEEDRYKGDAGDNTMYLSLNERFDPGESGAAIKVKVEYLSGAAQEGEPIPTDFSNPELVYEETFKDDVKVIYFRFDDPALADKPNDSIAKTKLRAGKYRIQLYSVIGELETPIDKAVRDFYISQVHFNLNGGQICDTAGETIADGEYDVFIAQDDKLDLKETEDWNFKKSGYKFSKWSKPPYGTDIDPYEVEAPSDRAEIKNVEAEWQLAKVEILGAGYNDDGTKAREGLKALIEGPFGLTPEESEAKVANDFGTKTLYVAFKRQEEGEKPVLEYMFEIAKDGQTCYKETLTKVNRGGWFYVSFDYQLKDMFEGKYEGQYELKISPYEDITNGPSVDPYVDEEAGVTWNLAIYKVVYDGGEGSDMTDENAELAGYATLSDVGEYATSQPEKVPTKEGYVFAGWNTSPVIDDASYTAKYTAEWTSSSASLSKPGFKAKKAEADEAIKEAWGKTPAANDVTDNTLFTVFELNEPVTGDTKADYTVRVSKADSEVEPYTENINGVGTEALFYASFDNQLKGFVGEDGDISGEYTIELFEKDKQNDDSKVLSSVTLKIYKVVYALDGGNIDGSTDNIVTYASQDDMYNVAAPDATPEKEGGATFEGWSDPEDSGYVRTYTAQWTEPEPSAEPSTEPSATPEPSEEPSATPTVEPSEEPSATPEPTEAPTEAPAPSEEPSAAPSEEPSATPEPTEAPTEAPAPSEEPSATPTVEPSEEPTEAPATEAPATEAPATEAPATATPGPVESEEPTETPTVEPSEEPSATPTVEPSEEPSATPTVEPSEAPTTAPTDTPTPTTAPTETPTTAPTATPTSGPVTPPTATPTVAPTETPTAAPTETPTVEPTEEPTATPTAEPSTEPSVEPTAEPSEEPTATPTPTATRRPSHSSGGYGGGGGSFGTGNSAATPTPTVTPVPGTTPVPGATNAPGTPGTPGSGQVFEDVPADYWAYDYIMDLYYAGIINGETPTMFVPEGNVTRAEFAKMAVLVFGLSNTATESKFEDVAPDDWFAPYVIAATEAGIVLGTSETTYSPNDTITREQIAAIIGRQLNAASENPSGYGDAADIEAYALPYVTGLSEQGILTGDNGVFRPKDYSTRAEAATIIDRVRTR